MEMFYSFFVFSLILSSSYAAVQDFCVADYRVPSGPAGYSCKRPENVKVNDFVYSGLGNAGNTSNIYRSVLTKASYDEVPSLNGLGISIARADLAPGGAVPLHTHPGSNEIFLLVKGKLIAGFISSDTNTVYQTTIKSGDIFVIPGGLLHFFVNIGGAEDNPVVAFASYSSSSIHVQIVDDALFKNNFPTELINRTTLLSISEIRRLKALFGGTK
ncbi:auxin-binding protein ABP19a-like [Argentina anserina]|uniref:auxin-binding protein ABP19a-like n=1 Tax=Argentina anserina TaxID=57926 RepID=UPI0021765444|nr:auxin-binding protein ABP19a-like [Potentilla anserina]